MKKSNISIAFVIIGFSLFFCLFISIAQISLVDGTKNESKINLNAFQELTLNEKHEGYFSLLGSDYNNYSVEVPAGDINVKVSTDFPDLDFNVTVATDENFNNVISSMDDGLKEESVWINFENKTIIYIMVERKDTTKKGISQF